MSKKFKLFGLIAAVVLAMTLAACGGDKDSDSGSSDKDSGDSDNIKLGDKDLTVPYVSWAGALVRTPLIKDVLEDVGYNVNDTQVDAGPMWSSVASGDASFMTASWLPATHKKYYEKYKDDVEEVGTFVDKAPLSLAVPKYMDDVDSIEDLKGNKDLGDKLDWTITGIDPGAGIMESTEDAIDKYGLDKWKLQESSEAGMLSELKKKYEDKKPIIVTGWKPHWMFAEMDLKLLDDPKEVYGGEGDKIQAIGNKDFKEDSPAAYEIVKRITEDYDEDMENELLVAVHDGKKEDEAAKDFLDDHKDLVKKWTKGIDD